MKLIIASNNEGKIKEFKKMLTPLGYEPVSMREAGINIDIEMCIRDRRYRSGQGVGDSRIGRKQAP